MTCAALAGGPVKAPEPVPQAAAPVLQRAAIGRDLLQAPYNAALEAHFLPVKIFVNRRWLAAVW